MGENNKKTKKNENDITKNPRSEQTERERKGGEPALGWSQGEV